MKPENRKYILENIGKIPVKDIAKELGLEERAIRKFLSREREEKKEKTAIIENKYSEAMPANRKIGPILVIILIFAVFAAYVNSLDGPFLLDDVVLIKENPLIRSISNIPYFFKKDIFANNPEAKPISSSYRPIQMVTHSLEFSIYKDNPKGFRLDNILIHLVNALLIFYLINILSKNVFLSFFVSLWFGIHPVNTQSVTYISGRADILVATFMLLSLISYIGYSKKRNPIFLFTSVSIYTLAIYTKELAIINLLLLVVIYNLVFDRKALVKITSYIFYVLPLAIYIPMRLNALSGLMSERLELASLSLSSRVTTSLKTLFIDLRILLFPYDLHFGRSTRVESSIFGSPDSFLTAIGILGAAILLILLYKQWNEKKAEIAGTIFFGVSWFIVSMIPLINIVPLQVFHSDNWLYLSSVGIYLTIGACIAHLIRSIIGQNAMLKKIFYISVCLALSVYGLATIKRNEDYSDEIKFCLSNLRWRPNVKLYRVVGGLYGEKKDYANAIKYLKKAIEINNIYPAKKEVGMAYYNLGIAYVKTSEYHKAFECFEKAANESDDATLKKESENYINHIRGMDGYSIK